MSLSIGSDTYVSIYNSTVFFTFFVDDKLPNVGISKNCYVVHTSGTTGKQKEVIVPYTAIMPNIVDFR